MKIHIYRDNKKEWRWRLVARNGKLVANGGESYKRKCDLMRVILKIIKDDIEIWEETK